MNDRPVADVLFISSDEVTPWSIRRVGENFVVDLPTESAPLSRLDAMRLINALLKPAFLGHP